jgi:hypothetical protein
MYVDSMSPGATPASFHSLPLLTLATSIFSVAYFMARVDVESPNMTPTPHVLANLGVEADLPEGRTVILAWI